MLFSDKCYPFASKVATIWISIDKHFYCKWLQIESKAVRVGGVNSRKWDNKWQEFALQIASNYTQKELTKGAKSIENATQHSPFIP